MAGARATVELAAGGVVLRRIGDELRVAVIHRDRHDDWALPKGHVEDDETWEAAALREVSEETGYRAEIVRMSQPIAYLVNGSPKLVAFFLMRLASQTPVTPSDGESDQVLWLPIQQASERISYDAERQVLASTVALPETTDLR
jgi:8-oxo-dGTP diphosphatase